jgi:hypothetical protein
MKCFHPWATESGVASFHPHVYLGTTNGIYHGVP